MRAFGTKTPNFMKFLRKRFIILKQYGL